MLELELLQVALGNRHELSRIPSAKEWDEIYAFAEKHAIVGVLFSGIERLPKPQLPYMDRLMDWVGQAEYIKAQNEQCDEDCRKVTSLFRKEGFNTSIMKGQGNARYYSDISKLRTSGDIDIWVSGGFEKVLGFVKKLNPTDEINELEIQLKGVFETPVEVHYRPFIMRNPLMNKRLQTFFDEESNACFNNDSLFTTMRFNLVHQMAHIRLHLFTEGIGLKQLIDYYFLLLHSEEDKADIMRKLEWLGLGRFCEAMMWVMKEVLLLPSDKLLCAPDEKGGRLLIEDVLRGGNFGNGDESLKERKSKMGYGVWSLLFRNIRYWRFDHWDWICGPFWRVYYRIWRKAKGYK